ncbi:hypothetical protein LZ017_01295 [Pelomonas sp. CA6]|uniref:hypothetical protein n=1 Tax=Pelomonas sp. CA6 TaxID=2907999 RepID=UPI001F4A76A2|nr:hypothetical protein [Pelomonas sp. CA6]MCH7342021.1 hypothetical protein [Pelomonas sp. CA6]
MSLNRPAFVPAGLRRITATAAALLGLTLQPSHAATADTAGPTAGTPPVIALVAAVGDRLTIVRQRSSTGTHMEPFSRAIVPIDSQALNFAALRGLQRAVQEEEPGASVALLSWNPTEAINQKINALRGPQRDDALLEALREHLGGMPERAGWSRIEAILPRYFMPEMKGMGSKLQGVGIYVQPLERGLDPGQELETPGGNISLSDNGGSRTLNPRTGEVVRAVTYVAPYIYFQRLTLDAKTLQVLARKNQYDNTKYHDPESTARDPMKHLELADLLQRVIDMTERSAYVSVRGKQSVEVSAPTVLPAASAASR